MIGVVFLFGHFSTIEIIVSKKNILCPIEDIDALKSNSEIYFYLQSFFAKFWEFENC